MDHTFSGLNEIFTSPTRDDGHEKWVDFAEKFWHCEIVSSMSKARFTTQYNKWCQKHGYNRSESKAAVLYDLALNKVATLPPTEQTQALITQAIAQLNYISVSLAEVRRQMQQLAASLREYLVVLAMSGVGETLGPQLIAEIGDVCRFPHKRRLLPSPG